jgi:hypothetical protein
MEDATEEDFPLEKSLEDVQKWLIQTGEMDAAVLEVLFLEISIHVHRLETERGEACLGNRTIVEICYERRL